MKIRDENEWQCAPPAHAIPPFGTRVALQDCLFLSLIVLVFVVLYIKDLGLYSDDWHFLGLLSNSNDQSLFALIGSVFPDTRLRPIESLYAAGLYWLFGIRPLEYHIVNALVFTVTILFFYLSLNEMLKMRLFTIAIPLVYAHRIRDKPEHRPVSVKPVLRPQSIARTTWTYLEMEIARRSCPAL